MKTPEEARKWWIEELRSGRWKQRRQYLTDLSYDTFCCLGVACELAIQDGVPVERNPRMVAPGYGSGWICNMPPEVMDWLGLDTSLGGLAKSVEFKNTQHTCLSGLNDAGANFEQIADIIEKGLVSVRTTDSGTLEEGDDRSRGIEGEEKVGGSSPVGQV